MGDRLLDLALLSLFVAVFVAIEGLFVWWHSRHSGEAVRRARRMDALTARASPDAQTQLRKKLTSNEAGLNRLRALFPRVKQLETLVEQSGVRLTLSGALVACAACGFVMWVAMLVAGRGVSLAFLAGLGGALIPVWWLQRARAARLKKFEQQLPEALDLIGRSLRAGHALQSALGMAGSELPAPAGELFQRVVDEIQFGINTPDALQNLARSTPSTDLKFFVIAVLIQRETGGNLAEVLSNISGLIRDRVKLVDRVQALSAEGRFSGLVLTALPFFTALLLYVIDGEFMSLLWTDDSGIAMLKGAAVLMVAGTFWMRQVVNIRV